MRRTFASVSLGIGLLAVAIAAPAIARGSDDDTFLEGYLTGVLHERNLAEVVVLEVSQGTVYLEETAPRDVREAAEDRLRRVPGVVEIRWTSRPAVGAGRGSVEDEIGLGEPETGFDLLPERTLFEPLSGDPRWPRFSASGLRYRDDSELGKVGAVSLGGTLPIWQADLPGEGRWEFAIQGSVFSIFDLDQSSLDLVNSDFFAAFPVYARWSWFSLMLRPYHQSSHLGDEFLLRNRVDRLDLSFEGVDFLASVDVGSFARLYGGGGILVHREPDDIERRSVQAGIELTSPIAFFEDRMRPIALLDVTRQEENDWESDYSARAGFQFENPTTLGGRRLQLLFEYYKGFSPNGQFFEREIEYVGVGLHFHQ